ncbi:MAG TPA: hypothetical protein VGX48_08065 [Pyrinomonadaceae bacterium]|jgi:hypothetical protein|nr:hypothetical protein [Pyrinomonadaceae bacterium]
MVRNAVRNSRQNSERSYATKLFLVLLSCFACAALSGAEARAQGCTYIPFTGSESIDAWITNADTGEAVEDGAVVPSGTRLRFDSVATADGYCVCEQTGVTYYRTVNHTNVFADISAGALQGRYTFGYVWGKNPGGTTAFWQVLDTASPDTTGPIYKRLFERGTYVIHTNAIINTTPCKIKPDRTDTKTITIEVN